MKNLILLLLLPIIFGGCTLSPDPGTEDSMREIFRPDPSPVEPEWVTFTRKPIVQSFDRYDNTNFEVSDQFIERTLQQKDYIDRVKKWKKDNLIP